LRVGARTAAVALALVGTAVSAYLTWLHYSGSLALCLGIGGCEIVQTSRYAMVGDVPVALVGLAGSVAMLAFAVARLGSAEPRLDLILFGLALAGTGYVAYLTYVELFVLEAVCPWCVIVALCTVGIFALVARDVLRSARP
jgi:uncharacterized membrane protein